MELGIIEGPQDAIALLNHTVEFTCVADERAIWILYEDHPQKGISSQITTSDGGNTLMVLNLLARDEYNNTLIQCAILAESGAVPEVRNATLLIQGTLSAVGTVNTTYNTSSVKANWTAPFSLDVTGVDHDIWYSVIIYNVTDENNLTVISRTDNITDTHYIFTPNYLNPCHVYNFSIIPYNGAGQGEPSPNATAKYIVRPLVSSTSDNTVTVTGLLQTSKYMVLVLEPEDKTATDVFRIMSVRDSSCQTVNKTFRRIPPSSYTPLISWNGPKDSSSTLISSRVVVDGKGDSSKPSSEYIADATIEKTESSVKIWCKFVETNKDASCMVVYREEGSSNIMIEEYDANSRFPVALNVVQGKSYTVAIFGKNDKIIEEEPIALEKIILKPSFTSDVPTETPSGGKGNSKVIYYIVPGVILCVVIFVIVICSLLVCQNKRLRNKLKRFGKSVKNANSSFNQTIVKKEDKEDEEETTARYVLYHELTQIVRCSTPVEDEEATHRTRSTNEAPFALCISISVVEVVSQLSRHAHQWKKIAEMMEFDEDMIDEIDTNNDDSDVMCLQVCVEEWITSGSPSLEKLHYMLESLTEYIDSPGTQVTSTNGSTTTVVPHGKVMRGQNGNHKSFGRGCKGVMPHPIDKEKESELLLYCAETQSGNEASSGHVYTLQSTKFSEKEALLLYEYNIMKEKSQDSNGHIDFSPPLKIVGGVVVIEGDRDLNVKNSDICVVEESADKNELYKLWPELQDRSIVSFKTLLGPELNGEVIQLTVCKFSCCEQLQHNQGEPSLTTEKWRSNNITSYYNSSVD